MKRDYKDFTDLVYEKNNKEERLRKVSPEERLLLQGFPVDWFSDLGLSNTDRYKMNGMHVPTVKYIGDCINEYHQNYVK
jgi:site-specific DNA-cytosine methylase